MEKVMEIRDYTALCLRYSELSHSAAVADTKTEADQILKKMAAVMEKIQKMRKEAGVFQ